MLAEFFARSGRRVGLFRGLRCAALEVVLENVFGRTRLAGDFAEAQEKRFAQTTGLKRENGDGLVFGGELEGDGVEILDAARQFGAEAESIVEFLDAFVERGGALEVELGAGAFADFLDGDAERIAAGVEKLHEAANFSGVFLFGAAGKARREAHFHFRVNAAGKRRIAANFDLAAANFEKVESLLGESVGGLARREGAVVSAGDGSARIVNGNGARDVTAWIGVA